MYVASEQNRFRIFAQAVTDVWYAKRPGAIFRENVAYRRWYAIGAAEDEAQRWMAALDGDEAPRRTPPPPPETARVESNAERLQRYRQRTDPIRPPIAAPSPRTCPSIDRPPSTSSEPGRPLVESPRPRSRDRIGASCMAAFVANFVPHLLAGLAERQRRFDQGAPPLLLSAGTLDLDGSPVVRCPYTALTFRAPRCLRCQGTRLILELAHGRELRAAVAGQPTLEQSVQALKAKVVALKAAVPLN